MQSSLSNKIGTQQLHGPRVVVGLPRMVGAGSPTGARCGPRGCFAPGFAYQFSSCNIGSQSRLSQ